MSSTIPQRQAGLPSPHVLSGPSHDHAHEGSAHDLLAEDNELRKQLEILARDNQQLMAALGMAPTAPADAGQAEEHGSLEAENVQLRLRVAALEDQLAASAPGPDAWAEQQKEYEALLEEKSEVIRALHQKLQEFRDAGSGGLALSGDAGPQRGELEELRSQLEAERDQLRNDETSVMQQMTQMEMTMSRERAEMARQRNELQRLHSDIRHELEVASRDSVLRDRLSHFQRRHQEVSGRKGASTADPSPAPEPQPPASPADTPLPKKNTGLLRRFFG